ncbi:MAG: hypothetical protein ACTHWW_00040 [Arthrobacter sp.]|uniref:hypothetical protein n=1 Tax=Arthrobacter TaxID=1663 RepID=UPI00264CC6FC|nr:hypothetical protein [Micrococcaceae bacterium]MDN5811740.1 hypothetical protein [Micrococcaceae bacterium]MDN5824785.1 hypothetical protein [Micrococcaceae bacterium]MDN5878582.1 hypothetical protein [Micrococcaceae bacterium]MDN5886143.1 hypothetical protein [Micrococcaceae bacterium]
MNIRQAIFASVASAGVLAAGWVGSTPPVAQATPAPAPYRLGSTTSGSAVAITTRPAASPSTLSSVRRQQLRGSEPVQLISTPDHMAPAGLAGPRA